MLDKVKENIERRSAKGHTSARVEIVGVDREDLFEAVEKLEEEGFVVDVGRREMKVFWYDEEPVEVGKLI